ncbi:hypothetical protein Ancab_029362 [Ancistrocladus abbreviatus]
MNYYTHDLSLLGSSFSDLFIESATRNSPASPSRSVADSVASTSTDIQKAKRSPPRHRHDGTSPLPLGMDWSPPPRIWDGRDSVWPLDPHMGWSYCVTVPSWTILPNSRGPDHAVFYRAQVGVQSPEAVTTITGVLRRFSDFLKLFSDLKKLFPKKNLPSAPPRRLLKIKSRTFLEERRCLLEDWMEKLLSDVDISRSAPVANFLELEAAARSAFGDTSMSGVTSSLECHPSLGNSLVAGISSAASDYGDDSAYEKSEIGTPRHGGYSGSEFSRQNSASDLDFTVGAEATLSRSSSLPMADFIETIRRFSRDKMFPRRANNASKNDKVFEGTSTAAVHHEDRMGHASGEENSKAHVRRLSSESAGSDVSSAQISEILNLGAATTSSDINFNLHEGAEAPRMTDVHSTIQFPSTLVVALPSELRHKLSRVLVTMQGRLATAKTDMEDLVARLNQEIATRQYLMTKVKDLEADLETSKVNSKENLQQAVSVERERFTQMQWDMEELQKTCLELEVRLKAEQDEKTRIESTKLSIIQENEMLLQELDIAREQIENLQKNHEESELKSKADVKVLVKEVKSLRRSQSELKQELSRLMKEKVEVERILEREKQRGEHANTTNAKLLHECEILCSRLQECSVNFLVEEEDKLIVDTTSSSDAIDLLTTSDNRIGLLLAEAQLLAQDVESALAAAETSDGGGSRTTDDDLRKMLTDIFIDNATLRKQINSVIRCALNTPDTDISEKDDQEPEAPVKKTVLSKFLER